MSNKANTGSLVSGIPTAFARVDLFKAAFNADVSKDTLTSSKNLSGYYKDLVSEWRGFLACIGLDYPNIKVRRVDLAYSDGKPIDQTSNIYEPSGAFGNMLLRRRARWCDQTMADNEVVVPYLNIIKYGNKVVGATAPETLLFTSTGYRVDNPEDKPWVDIHTKKFIDPLKSDLNEIQLKTLYAYVGHILDHLPQVEAYYPHELGVDLNAIRSNLENWQKEMMEYANNHNFGIKGGTVPPVDAGFSGPFAELFTYEDLLYGFGEGIREKRRTPDEKGFDPKKLLLPPTAKITRIHLSPEYSKNPDKLKELPVFVLTASIKGDPTEKAFFALPLSAQGLNIYGKSIGPLVGISIDGSAIASSLTATYDPSLEEDNLEVELSITTENGNLRRYCQCYTIGNDPKMLNKDILVWPNFVSKQWTQYYLYSELPHNLNQGVSAYPFVGDTEDQYFRIITDDNDRPILLAEDGDITAPSDIVNAKLLISSGHAVADNPYKYEIYRSDRPFRGVRLKASSGDEGGYLIINYSNDPTSKLPRNMLEKTSSLNKVTLGIDFGSTNTSVAYSDQDGTPKGFDFTNQRVSLLGQERSGAKSGIQENRILFFQAPEKPLHSNSLHSVLTIHDERRLGKKAPGENIISQLSREVEGGFPCFMDNLPVNHVSEDIITLKYPKIGMVQQIHNMKWTSFEKDKAYKKAYLRSLLLHVYAELFRMDRVPDQLRWSFPSAMSTQLLSQYKEIWDDLKLLKPVKDAEGNLVTLRVSAPSGAVKIEDTQSGGSRSRRPGRNRTAGGAAQTQNPAVQTGAAPVQPLSTPGQPVGMPDMAIMQQIQQLMQMQQTWSQMLTQPLTPEMFQNVQQQIQQIQSQIQNLMALQQQQQQMQMQQMQMQQMQSQMGFNAGTTVNQQAAVNVAPAVESPQEEKDMGMLPDDPDRVISYYPQPLFSKKVSSSVSFGGSKDDTPISLTEANAVANFLSTKYGTTRKTLIVCFDIGGSTTDITALYGLRAGLTMVKQNSIRFAAQRVSGATRYIKGFKEVLLQVCEKFDLSILGLNKG